MPNHVHSILRIKGDPEKIRELLESVQNDVVGLGSLDFNKVTPMPESLDIESGSRTDNGLKAYRDFIDVYHIGRPESEAVDLQDIPLQSEQAFLKMRPDITSDEWELGKAAFKNLQNYGAASWYDWRVANWGTKWNAYDFKEAADFDSDDDLQFDTAWGAPHPIIAKLAETYPELTFEHEWADEDLGYNCGRKTYENGNLTEDFRPDEEKVSMEFALKVWERDPADYELALNKTGSKYICVTAGSYTPIEIMGKPALYSNDRLSDEDITEGLYCYHLRASDDGDSFATIEPHVTVNHGGSVIMKEPLDFGDSDHIAFTEETMPNFLDMNDISLDEFKNGAVEEFLAEEERLRQGEMSM